jgi:hypothetical protein
MLDASVRRRIGRRSSTYTVYVHLEVPVENGVH